MKLVKPEFLDDILHKIDSSQSRHYTPPYFNSRRGRKMEFHSTKLMAIVAAELSFLKTDIAPQPFL